MIEALLDAMPPKKLVTEDTLLSDLFPGGDPSPIGSVLDRLEKAKHERFAASPGRQCTVCTHPDSRIIHLEMIAMRELKLTYRGLARRYGLAHDVPRRCAADHVLPELGSWAYRNSGKVNVDEIVSDLNHARRKLAQDVRNGTIDSRPKSTNALNAAGRTLLQFTGALQGDGVNINLSSGDADRQLLAAVANVLHRHDQDALLEEILAEIDGRPALIANK